MMKTIKLLVACAAASMAVGAGAVDDDKALLTKLQQRYPETRFTSVSRTPIAGVFEVVMGANVVYVGEDPRYFLFGRMVDVQEMRDLTAARIIDAGARDALAGATPFSQLPFRDAIKIVRGNGKRTLAVFSDPLCPYCKALESELAKLKDVTIYTFLVPFQGPEKPLAIWCSSDRAKAWSAYMLTGDTSKFAANTACDNPLQRNLALAERLHVRGTPTVIASDGRRRVGAVAAGDLEQWIASLPAEHKPSLATNNARKP